VSRLSALRETLEIQGQAFIDEKLEPLSRQRQLFEREERVLQLQQKWARVFADNTTMSTDELHQLYQAESHELRNTMVGAHDDYLSQRLVCSNIER
jgi:hypothetical protein